MNPVAGNTGAPGRLWTGGYRAARIFLGLVFVYASYDKILHPAAFAQAIDNYQILPPLFVNPAAVVLPWLELIIGVLLASGRWVPGAAFLSTALMGVFLTALIYNQVRGLDVHCGCFSTQGDAAGSNWRTVVRDAAFLLLSAFILICTRHSRFSNRRPAETPDGFSK